LRWGFFSKSCGSAPGQHNPGNCRQYLDHEQNNQQRNHDPHVDPEAAELIVCHGVSNILVASLTFQRRSRHVPLMFRRVIGQARASLRHKAAGSFVAVVEKLTAA
jgi:hypothetical protein